MNNIVKKFVLLFGLIPLLACHLQEAKDGEKHIFSAVIFRHGDRAPISVYPSSQYNDERFWPMGYGQLTKSGKERAYKIGVWFKERYGKLLENYGYDNMKNVYTISSDVDRTIMTGQLILSALFRASDNQTIDPSLGQWQPSAIHTLPESADNMLAFTKHCPRYDKEIEKLKDDPKIQKLLQENNELIEYVLHHGGYNSSGNRLKDFSRLLTVHESLEIERSFNYKTPDWVEKIERNLTDVSHYSLLFYTFSDALQRLRAGPLLKDIIAGLRNRTENRNNSHVLKLYSGHDYVIMGLMMAVKGDEKLKKVPYFVASLSFDLYEVEDKPKDEKYIIKVFFKNSTVDDEVEVNLRHCSNPCTVEKFEEIYRDVLPTNWEIECHLTGNGFTALSFLDDIPLSSLSLFAIGGTGAAAILYLLMFKKLDRGIITRLLDAINRRSPRQTTSASSTVT